MRVKDKKESQSEEREWGEIIGIKKMMNTEIMSMLRNNEKYDLFIIKKE